ncbi:MAG TPA: amidase [Candidatus Acidoferrales bacterium]|nr:amidase [Candidatus Acidoferrales bacterium]
MTNLQRLDDCLARIHDSQGEGKRTYIRLFEDQARACASAWDAMHDAGMPLPPLAGMPVSVKDLFDVAGTTTTAGSVALKDAAPAQQDAPVLKRLRAAGAVIVGTTNMTEFAMGGLGLNPHYGTPRNPYDRKTGRIPGGSSSGAAVSVTDGMATAAIGSDTAGSVRMPAAVCGLTGFKPTARRVPIDGSIPLAASLDSVGPLAADVATCALIDAVLAGEQPDVPVPMPLAGLRFAVAKTVVFDDVESVVADTFARALTKLSKAGARIVEIPFAELNEVEQASARGSFSVIEGYAYHRELLEKKRDLYDPIIAARFANGQKIGAADYIALRNARADLIERTRRVTSGFDAILMPTVPIVAPKIADLESDENRYLAANRLMIRNPGLVNFLDRCALTIPAHEPGSAPVGLTLMGETLADRRILSIGLSVEAALSA